MTQAIQSVVHGFIYPSVFFPADIPALYRLHRHVYRISAAPNIDFLNIGKHNPIHTIPVGGTSDAAVRAFSHLSVFFPEAVVLAVDEALLGAHLFHAFGHLQ